MQIPLLNLKKQYKEIKDEIEQVVTDVLKNGRYILGKELSQFEKEMAHYCNVKHALGVASGTDALLLSLQAIGVGRGDEVIVPTFSFIATANVVTRLGAKIVFVDIDPGTYNLDLNNIESKITKNTKAIIPVHLYGRPAPMQELQKITKKYGISIIEDACQAVGAEYKGEKIGNFGQAAALSFFPSKNLGCFGDGGMVLTNSKIIAEKIKKLRAHGAAEKKYFHEEIGYNSRLDEIQAAVLRVKLKHLNKWNKKRLENAKLYNLLFAEYGLQDKIIIPKNEEDILHIFHQYVIQVDERDELKKYLKKKEIKTAIYYPEPLHLQECFKELGYEKGDLPVAEKLSKKVLALPVGPSLEEKDIIYVVENIRNFYNQYFVKKNLFKKIKNKKAIVGVVGLGYVGLPLAVEKAKAGYNTIGFDIQEDKVEKVNKGENYIGDIVPDQLIEVVKTGKLKASSDLSFIKMVDTIAICVPTPLDQYYQPDVSHLVETAHNIAKYLHKGMLVILESTTYPGTTEEVVKPILEKSGLKAGKDFFIAFSPERVDPGNKYYKVKNTPKVVGGNTPEATELAAALYNNILSGKIHKVSSPVIAEMEKLLENTYRNINIALINEMAILCNKMDINIWDVIEAAKTKPYGFTAFYPGPGVGGHCIPVDPFYLTWKAREFNYHTRLIELAGEINNYMPEFVLERTMKILNNIGITLKKAKIMQLGLAYKQDIDDIRQSPAFEVFKLLKKNGADISYNDPFINKIKCGNKHIYSKKLSRDNLHDKDLIIITTSHSCYDYNFIQKNSQLIFDTKNAMCKMKNRENIILL